MPTHLNSLYTLILHIRQIVCKRVLYGKRRNVGISTAHANHVGTRGENGLMDDFLHLFHGLVKLHHGQRVHIHALIVEAVLKIELSVVFFIF